MFSVASADSSERGERARDGILIFLRHYANFNAYNTLILRLIFFNVKFYC
jgi:hypothetical protein